MTKGYFRCGDLCCGWIGVESEIPFAPSPFDPDETLTACPTCRRINDMRECCDEPECFREATCGTPIPDGYRRTCSQHVPKPKYKKLPGCDCPFCGRGHMVVQVPGTAWRKCDHCGETLL